MTKGRKFAPSLEREGIWFRHRGTKETGTTLTSTGEMLSAPFHTENANVPQPPSSVFQSKTETNYKHTNRFSDHDNRHHFQEHGVYFGDGRNTRSLGRKIVSAQERLHFTEPSYLKHFCRNPTNIDFNTTYGVSYEGEAINKPPVHRRFPKSLKEPVPGTKPKLDTSTTDWFRSPDIPHRTPTHVLAVSQEPFLKQNFWKYSNNSLKKIYPPYNRKETMKVNNILNRYGAAYAS